jgi:hypothetical protein
LKTSSRKYWFYLITVLAILGFMELTAFIASFYLNPDYYYKPATWEQFKNYFDIKNSGTPLGWGRVGDRRPSPAGKGMTTPFISLYGDSFTYGWDVPEEAAWGNVLTGLIQRRVDNYGVAAYGTDQACLDFIKNRADRARMVILSHLSENIVRNVNQLRDLLYNDVSRPWMLIKPRFITDDRGHLTLIPVPDLTLADYPRFVNHPEQYLPHEFFLPNHGPLTKKTLGFPYLLRVPYTFTYRRAYMRILLRRWQHWYPPPWFAEMYDPDHPSHALQVTRDIMINFVQEARKKGKIPLLFVIPTMHDIDYYRASGKWVYAPLLEQLQERGYHAYNLGPRLMAKATSGDLRDYFCTNRKPRDGHYTVAGNNILAEVARDILAENGLVP